MQIDCPLVNQITDRDINHNEDCVSACVASGATALLGRPVSLDFVKDAAYGAAYKGFQDAMAFQTVLHSLGLQVTEVSGYLPTVVVDALNRGTPVLLTIPSDWGDNPPTSPYSHVVIACDVVNSELTAMNPWGGFYQQQPMGWWVSRQRGNLYIISKDTTDMPIPLGWKDDPATETLTAPNQHTVTLGFREKIISAASWPAALQPTEQAASLGNGNVQQGFGLVLVWDKATDAITSVPSVYTASNAHLSPAAPTPAPARAEPVVTQVVIPEPAAVDAPQISTEPFIPAPDNSAEPVVDEVEETEPDEPAHNTQATLLAELQAKMAELVGKLEKK